MTKKYFILKLILLCIVFFSCLRKRSKESYILTEPICSKLYAEKYFAHKGGVYGGDLKRIYITDSLNFRKFIGTIDDKEYYSFDCLGGELEIKKISRRFGDKGIKETQILDVIDLINSKIQD